MASSNKQWPSMFKSKPCNNHHQWQHDITNSNTCQRSSYTTSASGEERTPEPKPRWNPKPEQIRILEAIFNSGMVNPPREEIRKIRAQLQEYGQVGDANVFYWFQNRKSRSKNKLRHLKQQNHPASATSTYATEKSVALVGSTNNHIINNKSTTTLSLSSFSSPTSSTNLNLQQTNYYHPNTNEFFGEPYYYPVHQTTGGGGNGGGGDGGGVGFGFSDLTDVFHQSVHNDQVEPCTNLFLNELINQGNYNNNNNDNNSERDEYHDHLDQRMKMLHPHLSYSTLTTTTAHCHQSPNSLATTNVQGYGDQSEGSMLVNADGAAKSTVFINSVAFEVAVGPINIREAFGDEAVLINSSGQPVLTNEWGVTLEPLQHGAFYYLV